MHLKIIEVPYLIILVRLYAMCVLEVSENMRDVVLV